MDRRRQETVITDLVRSLGTALRNRGVYPASHPLVRAPLDKCFSDLLLFFADRPDLALVVTGGTLVFEGTPVFNLTAALESFTERLVRIGAPVVIFEKGIVPAELEALIRFLDETRERSLPVERIQERLRVMGVSRIRVREAEEFEGDDLRLARRFYDNAVRAVASVVREVRLGRIPSGVESDRAVRNLEGMLRRNRDAILGLTLIKKFDEYTYNHSVNVALLSLDMADAMRLPESEKIEVGVAGLLHDVGKTQVALEVIRKPGKLTVEEFEEVKRHPEEGFVLLGKMPHIRPASAYMVLEHHMRLDRRGYPARGTEYRSCPNSGIIPVADTYDALTTMRSYQRARSPLEALDLMRRLGEGTLSPDCVALMQQSLGAYPIGTAVRLSTMEVGVVTAAGRGSAGPAKVALLVDRNGQACRRPETVHLGREAVPAGAGRRSILATVNPLFLPPILPERLLQPAAV